MAKKDSLKICSDSDTGKIVNTNFFRTLEINQKLSAIQKVFVQEKWLNLSKNTKTCSALAYSISLLSLPSSRVALKTNSLPVPVSEQQQLSSDQTVQNELGAPQNAPYPENCHYVTCLVVPWKLPLVGLLI